MGTISNQNERQHRDPYAMNHHNEAAYRHREDVNPQPAAYGGSSRDADSAHQAGTRPQDAEVNSADNRHRSAMFENGNRGPGPARDGTTNDQRRDLLGSSHGDGSPVRKTGRKDKYARDTHGSSLRSYYGWTDMDDVLQDKIAVPLRESGMPETKVTTLSAKITQAVRDDVIDANQNVSPQVTSNLSEVIHKHLDPILYNKANVTDIRDAQKANDAQHLSRIVLMKVGQVHEEVELCKLSVDDLRHKRGKAATPREELHDRSMLMAIKDGIEKQKTEKDILRDKLHQAHRDTQEVEDTIHKRQGELQHLDSDNWNLRQDLNNVEQTKQDLVSRLKEQEKQCDQLDKQNQDIRQENLKLRSRVHETEGQNHNLSSELSKLQSENAKLKVLINQKEKEILHLRDPDKDMVHKIRILSDEVTMLRTQTRRLNEEKAIHKSRSQKMESSLDESNRQKGKLSVERDNLLRENQELKQRYRKLALSNPQNRTLPDITTGRSGPSSYNTPRSNSRAPSRGTRYNNDRMSAAPEDEDDDDAYHR